MIIKALKYIGLTILVILVLFLGIIPLFLPSKIHVERSMIIKAAPETIYGQIANMRNWSNWSPWHQIDTTTKYTFFGPESGKGAGYTWESSNRNVGKGKLTVTEAHPDELVETEMDFMEHGKAMAAFKLEKTEAGTKVTWSMDSDMGSNPLGKWAGTMMDKMVGPDFEKGLVNLSTVTEKLNAN